MSRWIQVDCRDMNWTRAKDDLCRARIRAGKGDLIEIISNLRTLRKELGKWCDKMGDALVRAEENDDVYVAQIQAKSSITDCK